MKGDYGQGIDLGLRSLSGVIDRSIRLRQLHTGEQEHVSLSNAVLHNSVARAKHTHTHVGPYFVGLLVAQWVVIGQYAMGRTLMDRSIGTYCLFQSCVVSYMYIP